MNAVLDIGSNSVRMIVFDGEKSVFRCKVNSRLAEGLSMRKTLLPAAAARTVAAIGSLIERARSIDSSCGFFAFATEAVRRAEDGKDFLKAIEEIYGLKAELLSGEEEAEIALCGVLSDEDGAVLDIGGASSELAVRSGGKIVYEKSLKTGAGVLTDSRFDSLGAVYDYLDKKVEDYGAIPKIEKLFLIGGTASACGLISKKLGRYDFDAIDGAILDKNEIAKITEDLFDMTVDERVKKYGLDENRATVLPCGAALLKTIVDRIGPERIVVSERGNIEGYYFSRVNRVIG